MDQLRALRRCVTDIRKLCQWSATGLPNSTRPGVRITPRNLSSENSEKRRSHPKQLAGRRGAAQGAAPLMGAGLHGTNVDNEG